MSDVLQDVEFDLGIARSFGTRDMGASGLVSGWSEPEEGHVWNDGFDCVLQFAAPSLRKPCRLSFEGQPFIGKDCPRQDVVLFINGFRAGFWRLEESRLYTLAADIEPEHLFQRQGHTVGKCTWHLPDSVRPIDHGLGDDSRMLGFCFRSIALVPSM